MDENHHDKAESKLIATEDVRWRVNRKSKLWVPKHKKRTGFEDKTLWDWLQLLGILAIPLILGIATLLFGIQQAHLADLQHQSDQRLAQQQHDNDQKIANQQRTQDQQSALDQQRQATLMKYQDDMRDLLLNKGLLTSKPGDEIRIIALTETLSAMRQLDVKRNSFLIRFLLNAHLNGDDPTARASYNIVNFLGANLSDIDFSDANLNNADFSGAYLFNTTMSDAVLSDTNLSRANLSRANLSGAFLFGANLSFAILSNANLSGAYLSGTDLHGAILSNANLSDAVLYGAALYGADLSGADLRGVYNLTQQQLDQVVTCKGAILPKGLTCHNNQ